jgi:transcriptional regulator with PAS, ATPase and Fis domain
VLIRGESGVGKELVARALHRASPRRDRPLLSVNCAAIPRDLMESQLFGHKKGSFTGADADHVGWFQQAHTGMLFLDEVGELTLDGQAKLLRILEGHPFLPVGGTKEVQVDVRVIAATNRVLTKLVEQGTFRQDLYYRLNVIPLTIPPLRERKEDIPLLVETLLERLSVETGKRIESVSEEAMSHILAHDWPGNVRELRNVLERGIVIASGSVLRPEHLGDLGDGHAGDKKPLSLEQVERRHIAEILRQTAGNVSQAARILDIDRATLYTKIRKYDLRREEDAEGLPAR